ncbi:MAG: 5-formyltetrahydrofolate cyclo-ligase [Steroidobacteraceae bacterium]
MKKKAGKESAAGRLSSSPCMLGELREDGTQLVDPEQARDVARWRKAERERLIKARCSLDAQYRTDQAMIIARKLEEILAASGITAPAVSLYWPIRGEPDLLPWMHTLSQAGVRVALPVAVALAQPLIFREWRPGSRLARGLWKIPYPADGEPIVPHMVIAPVVGFDHKCYRLGYGGGFFDRTLAQSKPKPLAIGVGYPSAELRTIFPQPHDIPMDWVVTGSGTLQFHC